MMEQDYRQNEGRDQLDLFPVEQPPKRIWRFVPYTVVVLVILMMFAPKLVHAGEPVILTQALICDTEDEVKDQLDIFSSADRTSTKPMMVEGCGALAYPSPAILTPTTVYENKYIRAQLATIEMPDYPVQYGYVSVEPLPPSI